MLYPIFYDYIRNSDNKALNSLSYTNVNVKSFAKIPIKNGFYYNTVSYVGSDEDAPYTTSDSWWWNVISFGYVSRFTQIAFCPFRQCEKIFIRHMHDTSWNGWFEIEGIKL